jgi:hypothetical protein
MSNHLNVDGIEIGDLLTVAGCHGDTVAPTVNDDGVSGYPTGTTWIDTTAEIAYISVKDSTGAAVWKQIS